MDFDNSGILARNTRRETEKHPEYSGSITVAGQEYWLSAWVNDGKPGSKMEGQKYFRLSVSPKKPAGAQWSEDLKRKPEPEFNDDVPFN